MKKDNEQIWQVLTFGKYYDPVCHEWFTSEEEANEELERCKRFWGKDEWWIEEGTGHISDKCRGCGSIHISERFDAYGIPTGYWCDDCYENNYPYKKNRYDYEGYGERLDDDY